MKSVLEIDLVKVIVETPNGFGVEVDVITLRVFKE